MSSIISFFISVSYEFINLICCVCINIRFLVFFVVNGDIFLIDFFFENFFCLFFRGFLIMIFR